METKTNPQYTKGKWTILALERGHEDRIKIVSDVAENGYFPLVCFVHGTGNREANAQLISASPDMYEALKQAQEGTGDWRGVVDLVIEKAEGRDVS